MPRPTQRPALLDAAARVLVESGPTAFTLDAVAAKAGVSKGGILYHFPTKQALYRALCEREIAAFEALEAQHDSSGETATRQATAYIRANLDLPPERGRMAQSLLMASLAEPDAIAPFHAWIRARLQRLVKQPGGDEAVVRMLASDALWLLELLGGPLPDRLQKPVVAKLLSEGRS